MKNRKGNNVVVVGEKMYVTWVICTIGTRFVATYAVISERG